MKALAPRPTELWDDETPAGGALCVLTYAVPCAVCTEGRLVVIAVGERPRRIHCPMCKGSGLVGSKMTVQSQGVDVGRAAGPRGALAARPGAVGRGP